MKELTNLSPRINQIVMYYFENPKLKYTDLAIHFNISVQRISQIMNNPRVIGCFPALAKRKIKSLVPKATGRLEELMNQNFNAAVSEKVVSKILDSEHVLEPQPHRVIHELELKTVAELQDIIKESAKLPIQAFEAEIVSDDGSETK